jgi:hypothetical protein
MDGELYKRRSLKTTRHGLHEYEGNIFVYNKYYIWLMA